MPPSDDLKIAVDTIGHGNADVMTRAMSPSLSAQSDVTSWDPCSSDHMGELPAQTRHLPTAPCDSQWGWQPSEDQQASLFNEDSDESIPASPHSQWDEEEDWLAMADYLRHEGAPMSQRDQSAFFAPMSHRDQSEAWTYSR